MKPRHQESRAAESRKADLRAMPRSAYESRLYIPPNIIPKGMTYSWVRVASLNQPDNNNWRDKIARGWKPVPRERHVDRFPHIPLPGIQDDATYINNGDLILCEKPTREVAADKRAQQQETWEQMNAVSFSLEGAHAAPTLNESSKVNFERVVAKPAEFQE